jgi:hypothetical protein
MPRTCKICSAIEPDDQNFLDGLCEVCTVAVDREAKKRAEKPPVTMRGLWFALQTLLGLALSLAGIWQLTGLHSPIVDGWLAFAVGSSLLFLGRRR